MRLGRDGDAGAIRLGWRAPGALLMLLMIGSLWIRMGTEDEPRDAPYLATAQEYTTPESVTTSPGRHAVLGEDAQLPDRPDSVSRLSVVSADGAAIEGATVSLLGASERSRPLGATDANGSLALVGLHEVTPAHAGGILQLSVGHEDYVSRVVDLVTVPAAGLRLVLEAGAALFGTVLLPDGSAAGSDVLVVVSSHNWLTPDIIESLLAADEPRGWRLAGTDDSGCFRVGGLESDRPYHVWAASASGVSPVVTNGVRPDESPIIVGLNYAWGLKLKLCNSRGVGIEASTRYFLSGREESAVKFDGRKVVMLPRHFMRLAGFGRDVVQTSPDSRVLLAVSAEPVAPVIAVSLEPPGYQRLEQDLVMRPLSVLGAPVQVMLQQACRGFGVLQIALVGTRCLSSGSTTAGFRLQLVDGMGSRTDYMINVNADPFVVMGVPYGSYEARIINPVTGLAIPPKGAPPAQVVVGETPAVLECNLSQYAELTVDIVGEDGASYVGPISVVLTKGSLAPDRAGFRGQSDSYSFSRRPYVLHGLAPGSYSVSVAGPAGVRFSTGSPLALFDVVAAEQVTVSAILSH